MTVKQKKAVKLLEKVGSVGEAMRQAGYSDTTSQTPQKLTEAKGFKELLAEHLNPNEYFPIIRKNFYASKRDQFSGEIYDDVTNQLKATDQANKLNGFYKDEPLTQSGNINITYVIYSPDHARSTSLDTSGPVQDAQLAPQSPQDDSGDGQVNL